MGSSLSPVIGNFFMVDFEDLVLSRATYKPTCWFHYVYDMFVVWPCGPENLNDFFNHLNRIHPSGQFTMETESDDYHPFLDIDIIQKTIQLLRSHYMQEANPHELLSECQVTQSSGK
jgi:hypothetical protein